MLTLRLVTWFLLFRLSSTFHRPWISLSHRKPCTMWNSLHPSHHTQPHSIIDIPLLSSEFVQWTTTHVKYKALTVLLSLVMVLSPTTASASFAAEDTAIFSSSSSSLLQTETSSSSSEEKFDEKAAGEFVAAVSKIRPLFSDEFVLTFKGDSLGLGLTETYYKGFPVTTVNSIKDPILLQQEGSPLRPGAIVIGVGDEETNGIPLKDITAKIQNSGRPVTIKFRDPSRYFELLDSTIGAPKRVITTSYLPANTRDVGAPEQVIKIERLKLPPPEQRVRSAQLLDVMEIQYVAQLPNYTDR